MLEFLRKLSIRKQLLVLVICTLIVISLVIFVEYFKISDITIKTNNEYTSEIFSQIKRNISDNSELLTKMLNSTAYNKVVQEFMTEKDPEKAFEQFQNVDSVITNMKQIKDDIIDFIILSESGNDYFMGGSNPSTLKALEEIPKNVKNYYSPMKELSYLQTKKNCFIVASTIHSIKRNSSLSKSIGTVAIVVDAKIFSVENNSKLKDSATQFFLIDRNNTIYSSNQGKPLIGSNELVTTVNKLDLQQTIVTYNKKKYVINLDKIPQIGGKIVSVTPEDELLKNLLSIRKLSVIILITGIVLLSIPFTIIINNILQPLNKFTKFMDRLKSGSLKTLKERVHLVGYSEIEGMSGEFNNMLDEIDGLTHRLINTSTRLYETELDKKQAEMAYLKSQINPHFLYNTLESMIGTAFNEGAKQTVDMIKALAAIFRYSVKGTDIVTLKEELQIIKSYIYIQQIRFSDMFDVKYQVDENTLDCSIPKIILQPIVENAISHGLETSLEFGHLEIGSRLDEQDNLLIWVYDNGVGIEDDVLDEIKKQIADDTNGNRIIKNNSSIGVANVSNRIKLMYGDEYGVKIDSKSGEGTRVRIKIPVRRG